jgi:hypothetical protein
MNVANMHAIVETSSIALNELHCIQFASHLLIFPQSSFNSVSAQHRKFLPSFHWEITTPPGQIIKPECVSGADETKYHRAINHFL